MQEQPDIQPAPTPNLPNQIIEFFIAQFLLLNFHHSIFVKILNFYHTFVHSIVTLLSGIIYQGVHITYFTIFTAQILAARLMPLLLTC